MITKYPKHWFGNLWRAGLVTLAILLVPQAAFAQTEPIIDYSANDINYYDPRGNNVCSDTSTSGDTLSRFLQALALQENGGKVTGGSDAKGKYQYIDSTWHLAAKAYYPPGDAYANANAAPEEIQDAVVYIEYSVKMKKFNGDLFKMAVSHYYPAALNDPGAMDTVPPYPGNFNTPRQYGQQVVQKFNANAGKNIPIKASSAPEFQTYLDKVGGQGGGGASSGALCTTNGVVAGDIVRTALGLAWPNPGHSWNKEDATLAYQAAMPKYNPSSAATNNFPYSDCGVFVATVISATVDPNYQKRGTSSQIAYIQQHPEKYDYFTSSDYTQSSAKLQPGDILIHGGHTYIFTGPYKGSDGKMYNAASASWHNNPSDTQGHVPQAVIWRAGFNVARVKK